MNTLEFEIFDEIVRKYLPQDNYVKFKTTYFISKESVSNYKIQEGNKKSVSRATQL